MSYLEEKLYEQISWVKEIPKPERQYRFNPNTNEKADFAWPTHKVIVEVEGGLYKNKKGQPGRHVQPYGFIKDCEKYNWATINGWRVLRVTAEHIGSGEALQWIEAILI